MHGVVDRSPNAIEVGERDLVILQDGSVTDASSLGSVSRAPAKLTKADSHGWALLERLAEGRPAFGKPHAFHSFVARSCWESFTVTMLDPAYFESMTSFSGNEPDSGGLVTFKNSP